MCKKGAILNYLHDEYLNLRHDTSFIDFLPETDNEDESDSKEEN